MACAFDRGAHDLREVGRQPYSLAPDAFTVVRWCAKCGAVVIDTDLDGRTMPGDILPMQFPRIATKKREG